MKKVALPVNGNKLSPFFSKSQDFTIYTIENQKIIDEKKIHTSLKDIKNSSALLIDKKVTDIIVRRIGQKTSEVFYKNKIHVYVGVELKTPKELVDDFIKGTLVTNGSFYTHSS